MSSLPLGPDKGKPGEEPSKPDTDGCPCETMEQFQGARDILKCFWFWSLLVFSLLLTFYMNPFLLLAGYPGIILSAKGLRFTSLAFPRAFNPPTYLYPGKDCISSLHLAFVQMEPLQPFLRCLRRHHWRGGDPTTTPEYPAPLKKARSAIAQFHKGSYGCCNKR